jgi:glyoxylase-like metal-dependent hydrolase (beta-lactamase superfamily II)
MSYAERLDNIYVIDTMMLGFEHYGSAFLVKGKELAMIDTALPNQTEALRAGIKAHGFSVSDISQIFITHCEHWDHSGSAAPLLEESPRANVYIHPAGMEFMTNPEIESADKDDKMPPEMRVRFGEMAPVPRSRIKTLKDGDVFDLGDGEKLKIIFAPGHQPGGLVILEEKNKGMFVNDLVGNCFADADSHYALNPYRSDHVQAIESLKMLMDIPLDNLYLGHYGISKNPKQVITKAIDFMQQLLDIGMKNVREGKPELIAPEVYATILPELKKLGEARGGEVYKYAAGEHVLSQAGIFAKYCQKKFGK